MVDFYVDADDVLGSSYNVTSLECNNYNPNIDGTVTVTVTVEDVYDDPVVGEVVTVTASAGNFTALNGESITASATVDGTTDAGGQFTLTYNCTEWGLITFSANTENIQIRVNGWKQVATKTVSGVTYTLTVNGQGLANLSVTCSNVSFASGTSHEATNWIPSAYLPSTSTGIVLTQRSVANNILIYFFATGTVGVNNTYTSAQTMTLSHQLLYCYI